MTRPILIPGGRFEATARRLNEKLAGVAPWEPIEHLGITSPAPPLWPEVRMMATAGLLMLGLVVLLFLVP